MSLIIKESQKSQEPISILEICEICGHADPTVTLSVYAGLFPNATEKAMRSLNDCKLIRIPSEDKEGLKFYA